MQLHFLCLKTSNDVCPWLLTGLINVVSSISYSTLYICNHIFFFLLKCNYTRYAIIFFFSLESFQMQLWWTLHNVNNQRQPYHEKKKIKKNPPQNNIFFFLSLTFRYNHFRDKTVHQTRWSSYTQSSFNKVIFSTCYDLHQTHSSLITLVCHRRKFVIIIQS